MQRVVRASRAQLTVKQLQGFNIDSSFGSLAQFTDVKWFKTLVARHNDPEDEFLSGAGGRGSLCPNETGLGQTHPFEL
jgi:hypothetical protein